MRVSCGLRNLIVFCIIACCYFKPSVCSVHCGRSQQVLDSKWGEIASSAYSSWSYRYGAIYDCWVIEGPKDEPIVLSFSQFFVRCKKESVTLKSSAGGEPVVLCGSKLPQPIAFPGGNITVTHHFFPHLFPVSSFLLSYARDNGDCPVTSYKCSGRGRCIPLSWRCNGRVECGVDEGGWGLGSDEQGCDEGEGDVSSPPPYPRDTVMLPRETTTITTTTTTSVTTPTTENQRLALGEVNEEPTAAEPDLWELLRGRSWEDLHPWATPTRPTPPTAPPPPRPTPPAAEWPCGGLIRTFYGTFGPPAAKGPPLSCVWTLDPQDARPLRLDLQQLQLGPGDTLTVHNRQQGTGDVIKIITSASNAKPVQVESRTGLLSLTYSTPPGSEGRGFNATFRVGGYCPPWEGRCGGTGGGGCFAQEQRCDGRWDCPETGADEEGCRGCGRGLFACGGAGQRSPAAAAGHMGGRAVCYPDKERCNYQLYCADGSDERDCTVCKPGTFHCDSDRCVFESWRCDGQVDCKDGTDELNCAAVLPRKVITAATVGSLVCGLLLVIAMGCTCKLYSLRTREYSMFAPISRQEAELIQQQAPPSYGQLIAQGIIPPVEDFPTENPNEASPLSLRGLLHLLRQDTPGSPRRHRRRPRFVRRAVRRMRRWGLMARVSSRPAPPPTGSGPQPSDPPQAPPASAGAASLAAEAANQPAPQKLGLLALSSLTTPPPPPPLPPLSLAPPPPPPYVPPATPPVGVPPPGSPSPSLASIFHTLGLTMSLFRASPSPSTNSMALSTSSSSSDDEVLLIPMTEEDHTSEDDVPMLT